MYAYIDYMLHNLLTMRNINKNTVSNKLPIKEFRSKLVSEMSGINISSDFNLTTADHLLYVKDRLDKGLIDYAQFRMLRDKLTYGDHDKYVS